jgi:hypothetical protein
MKTRILNEVKPISFSKFILVQFKLILKPKWQQQDVQVLPEEQ